MITRKCPRKITISRIMRRLMSNYERIKDHKMSHKNITFHEKIMWSRDKILLISIFWAKTNRKIAKLVNFDQKMLFWNLKNGPIWAKKSFCKKKWISTYKYSSMFGQEGIRVRKEMDLCPGREPCTSFLVLVYYNQSASFLVMYHNP